MHIKKIFTSYIRRLSIQKLVIFKRKDSEKKSRRNGKFVFARRKDDNINYEGLIR